MSGGWNEGKVGWLMTAIMLPIAAVNIVYGAGEWVVKKVIPGKKKDPE